MRLRFAQAFALPCFALGFDMLAFLKWVGTIASVIGSFVVAGGFMLPGYSLFMLGSVSWLAVARATRDNPLAVLNTFFFLANILGFYRAI